MRGIKHIELEADEKAKKVKKQDSVENEIDEIDEVEEQTEIEEGFPARGGGKKKLTLTNIVEEEISPTSKSTASVISKPIGGAAS